MANINLPFDIDSLKITNQHIDYKGDIIAGVVSACAKTTYHKCGKKYKPSIANYFKSRKNSGFVEGLNNKIKVVKRRCYGFFKIESYFQRLFLDLKGYDLYAA